MRRQGLPGCRATETKGGGHECRTFVTEVSATPGSPSWLARVLITVF